MQVARKLRKIMQFEKIVLAIRGGLEYGCSVGRVCSATAQTPPPHSPCPPALWHIDTSNSSTWSLCTLGSRIRKVHFTFNFE